MKIPKLFKKAAALLMAAVTAFSVMPATTAFAQATSAQSALPTLMTGTGMPYDTIPVMYSTDIPQAAQESTTTVCMWTAILRFVFSQGFL